MGKRKITANLIAKQAPGSFMLVEDQLSRNGRLTPLQEVSKRCHVLSGKIGKDVEDVETCKRSYLLK